MVNIEFGFVVFEKCTHCNQLRTYFTRNDFPVIGDKYREGDCFWSRVENAQSLQFDLRCSMCGHMETFRELMGFLHCTGCLEECKVEILQKQLEEQRTWILVAFGFLAGKETRPIPPHKLEILTDYFNQNRDTSRSRIRLVSFEMITDLSRCKGDFIHDVDMLSAKPPEERRTIF